MVLAILSILLSVAYAAIMLSYLRGWRALAEWQIPPGWIPQTRVTVVIAARNEAANIAACLRSVTGGSYPHNLLEIIVVDDFSEDETAAVVDGVQQTSGSPFIRLVKLSGLLAPEARFSANKKKAVAIGIARAQGELIVTTDADCVVPADWLRLIVSAYEAKKSGIICAPVAFRAEKNLFQRFQSLDFLGLIGITGAGIRFGFQRMGNGANLAFPKAVFEEAGGFSGNEHLASGDDMFLVQKVAESRPSGIFFLKNPGVAVLTEAQPDWRSFFQQRLRWGTKNAALPEWPVRLILLSVFLFCWTILINAAWVLYANISILFPVAGAPDAVVGVPANNTLPLIILLIQLLVKAVFDYTFLRGMCRYFSREDLMRWFIPSFFMHTVYIALVGAASIFSKKYEWKGRRVK